jgi:hypothetical protein
VKYKKTGRAILLLVCSASLVYTLSATYISKTNYTGGEAMLRLDNILRRQSSDGHHATRPTVSVDWYACVNGALDSQIEPGLALVTKRNHTFGIEDFDYRITHEPRLFGEEYEQLESIGGWAGLAIDLHNWQPVRVGLKESVLAFFHDPPIRPTWREKVWIMGKKD